MKVLVVGGTLFLGRAVADKALADGHQVALFNRGKTNPQLFPETEHLRGDRDADLTALVSRDFDAVIDTSAYFPRQVTTLLETLGEVGHYTMVSSISVYAHTDQPGADESADLATVPNPDHERLGEFYGGFKALCEQAAHNALPGRTHNVRAGLIVGPHDNTGRFSYWVERLARGGEVLVPEPRTQPVQFIDVRDLAEWILHAATTGITGAFNATSPPGALTLDTMLQTIRTGVGVASDFRWVAKDFLLEHEVAPWTDLPLWLPLPSHTGFMACDTTAAQQHGLVTRPLAETVEATLTWLQSGDEAASKDFGNPATPAGLEKGRERSLLDAHHRL